MEKILRHIFLGLVICLSAQVLPADARPVTLSDPPIADFLDAHGRLNRQVEFSGAIDPTGFQLVSGSGEEPRFAKAASAAGAWTGFGGLRDGCNGPVHATAVLPSGDVVVAGKFSICGKTPVNNIASWNGSTWSSMGLGLRSGSNDLFEGIETRVGALAVVGNDLYAAGTFRIAGNVAARRIARWNGSDWTPLGQGIGVPGFSYEMVFSLAVIGNNLYAGGEFVSAGGSAARHIAVWNGNAWSNLGTGVSWQTGDPGLLNGDYVRSLAVVGGDLYVGGYFALAGGVPAANVARWDGSDWSSLGQGSGNGVGGQVSALVANGSDIYVAGSFSQAGGVAANHVARWSGNAWNGLGTGVGGGFISALATIGGDLYVGGSFTQAGGVPANDLARWNGIEWSGLGLGTGPDSSNVYSSVQALTANNDELYVGGAFNVIGGTPANNVVRRSPDDWHVLGEQSAAEGINGQVFALGKNGQDLYVGGRFSRVGGVAANGIARWNGSSWNGLGTGESPYAPPNFIRAITFIGNDLYVGGNLNALPQVIDPNGVARWDGSNWNSLATGVSGGFYGIKALAAVGSDLYVGGSFTLTGSSTTRNLARWDGSNWSALGPLLTQSNLPGEVRALAAIGNDLYVGGNFVWADSVAANYVARWDGNVWNSLGLGASNGLSGAVDSLAIVGKELYAGGEFTQAGGLAARCVARWNGSSWSSLGTGASNGVWGDGVLGDEFMPRVHSLAEFDGNLYVGGDFTSAGGGSANRIASWDSKVWSSLAQGIDGVRYNSVYALAAIGQSLFVGGSFVLAGTQPSSAIATWKSDTIFEESFE